MSWYLLFFFFSSRRRHTRYWRDWSSDVCSSDLTVGPVEAAEAQAVLGRGQLGQAAAVTGHEGVPVDPGLDVAAALVAERPLQLGLGPLAQGVQAPVEHRHVCLFLFQLSGEILHP